MCVTLVRLCSDHTFIAIGFKDGLLALVNYLKPSVSYGLTVCTHMHAIKGPEVYCTVLSVLYINGIIFKILC